MDCRRQRCDDSLQPGARNPLQNIAMSCQTIGVFLTQVKREARCPFATRGICRAEHGTVKEGKMMSALAWVEALLDHRGC